MLEKLFEKLGSVNSKIIEPHYNELRYFYEKTKQKFYDWAMLRCLEKIESYRRIVDRCDKSIKAKYGWREPPLADMCIMAWIEDFLLKRIFAKKDQHWELFTLKFESERSLKYFAEKIKLKKTKVKKERFEKSLEGCFKV